MADIDITSPCVILIIHASLGQGFRTTDVTYMYSLSMALFATIYNSLSLGNVLLLLLLLFVLHYLMVLYDFRNMPPGPRLTTLPVLGNVFSLDYKVEKPSAAFQRSVNSSQYV